LHLHLPFAARSLRGLNLDCQFCAPQLLPASGHLRSLNPDCQFQGLHLLEKMQYFAQHFQKNESIRKRMKNFMYAMILALSIVAVGCDKSGGDAADGSVIKDNKDSVSYAIGYDIGKNFATQGVEVNLAVFTKALEEGLAGTTPKLDEQTSRNVMMAYQQVLQKKQQEKRAAEAGENMQKSTKFLADNKAANSAVIELPSGLQYQVIKEGTGKQPTLEDQVTTNYHGTLMDGSVFDSSRERGEPATFPLKGVIQAWQQILPLMKEGATYKIWAPPALAYGEYGSPPKIGPNVALVFEIDLIKVLGPAAATPGQPGM
jgi:FKBP-type peptidyl-prolyl cis-trans isomerase FklB